MILTIITFFVVLSILVLVHEFGHFWTARKFGVKADEFGLGYPPRIIGIQRLTGEKLEKISKTEEISIETKSGETEDGTDVVEEIITDRIKEIDKPVPFTKWRIVRGKDDPADVPGMKGDTIFSLNWVPIGGFVKIKGEDGDSLDPDSFTAKPIWQRAIILLAGVTMNFLLAIVVISIGFMVGLPQVLDGIDSRANISNRQVQVVEILANSPAAKAELKAGDIVVSVNGEKVDNGEQLQSLTAKNEGKQLSYKIKRGQEELEKKIVPEVIAESGKAGIGVGIAETGTVRYPFFYAIWEGCKTTAFLTLAILTAFYDLFKNLFTGQGLSADLGGPVKIAVLTGQVAQMGFIYLMQFTAMLSINLAIINAVPFPALDGGRTLFLLLELIFRRPVKREIEGAIHYIGFILLMVLVVAVTYRDIASYSDKFHMIWQKLIG